MNRTYTKAVIIALVALAMMTAAWWRLCIWYHDQLLENSRSAVFMALTPYSHSFSSTTQQRVALLEALDAYIRVNPSKTRLDRRFGQFASYLYASTPGIRLLAIAPKGVVSYVYPHGHEGLIGKDLMSESRPRVKRDIEKAINSRQIVMSGPYELKGGKPGLIARKAVFDQGDYWGMVIMVLDVRRMIMEAGMMPSPPDLKLALVDAEERVLIEQGRVLEADPVSLNLHLPGETWILSAVPANGWGSETRGPLYHYALTGLFLVVLITILVFLIAAYQGRLQAAVASRTAALRKELKDRLQAQSALRKREEQFRSLAEFAPTPISILGGGASHREKFLYVNNAWEKLTGYSKKEAESLKPIDLVAPEMRNMVEERGDARIRGEQVDNRYIVRKVTKDGQEKWIDFSVTLSEMMDEKVVVTVSHDITDRKKAEEALKKSEALFRNLFNSAPVGVFRSSSDGYFLDVNPAMTRILGAKDPEQAVEYFSDLPRLLYVNPERRGHLLEKLKTDGFVENFEVEIRQIAGTRRWISLNARMSERISENAFVLDGFAVDITHSRATQERILHLNRVLRSLREISILFYKEKNPDYLVQQVCNILTLNGGYFGAMIVRIDERFHPDQEAIAGNRETFEPILKSFEQGIVPPCCMHDKYVETSVQLAPRPDACRFCPPGARCPITGIICKPLQYENRVFGYIAVSQLARVDRGGEEQELITRTANDLAFALHNIEREKQTREVEKARDRAEEQLLHAQKMEAVGRLAGGVAHDFNNMLNVILGYASIARSRLNKDDLIYNYILEIEQAAQRSAELTGQLLTFSRKQITAPRVVDLNEIVADQQTLLSRLIGEEIVIRFDPAEDLWPIRIDPFQIDQILTNMAVNSRDAIEGMGTVSIRTENVRSDSMTEPLPDLPPGDFVLLTFSDSGAGMDETTMEQIFEPFFTTKETGKGTGLGLSTVYGIMKQNKGAVTVESKPGEGTTFRLYFPRHLAETETAESLPTEREVSGSETVLVVEDEEQVLNLTEMILKGYGYTVLKAKTPGEAVEIANRYTDTIDLLLTDVIMPEMNGRELKTEIETISPGIRTLFMSGYTNDVVASKGIVDEESNFIVKPFTVDALARKVREVLDHA